MKKVLVVHSSPLGSNSLSRQITEEFLRRYARRNAGCDFVLRDLAKEPIPHISGAFVEAMFVPPDRRTSEMTLTLALAHRLTGELEIADDIVISSPMYNRSVPSSLKAWIDHIVLPFTTFNFGPQGPEGHLKNKTAYFICATGGVYSNGPGMEQDFLTPYIKNILGFIGIKDVRVIFIEGVAHDQAQGLKMAEAELDRVLEEA